MSTFYQLAYRFGFHPWEDAAHHRPFVETIEELFDTEEAGREPPYGRALDVGTGSGIWAVELAKRGWQVTGIDTVARALERAHDRVRFAGVDVNLIHGDVTELRDAGVDTGYRLVLDTGTFHGLGPDEREAMGREITTVTEADATVLLLAWVPRRRGPLPSGASIDDIKAAFPDWRVTEVGPSYFQAPKPVELLMKPEEHWYRLRRAT